MEFFTQSVGELSSIPSETTVEWKIQQSHSGRLNNARNNLHAFYESPMFPFVGASWALRFYPNGQTMLPSNNCEAIDFYLVRKTSGSPINVKFSLGLKTVNGKTNPEEHFTHSFDNGARKGTYNFFKKSELLARNAEFLSSNCLLVVCKMKHVPPPEVLAAEKISFDFEKLMLSGDHSDVIIKVKEREFKLHRNILSARSPYFNSMFRCDMREKSTGIVTVQDCEPSVFCSFIHYLYTGRVDKFVQETVSSLYETADKYQEDGLKKDCVNYMLRELSIDNFCDFIALSLRYDEKELTQKGSEMFSVKGRDIARRARWQNFMKEHPAQANEFIKILNSQKKRSPCDFRKLYFETSKGSSC